MFLRYLKEKYNLYIFVPTFSNDCLPSNIILIHKTRACRDLRKKCLKLHLTRNVCITKHASLYKISNGIMVMTPK